MNLLVVIAAANLDVSQCGQESRGSNVGQRAASIARVFAEPLCRYTSQGEQGLHLPRAAHLLRLLGAAILGDPDTHAELLPRGAELGVLVRGDGGVPAAVRTREYIILVAAEALQSLYE